MRALGGVAYIYFSTVGLLYAGVTTIMRRVLGATIDSYGISAESSWVSCDDRRKRRAAGLFVVATQVVLVPVTWILAADAFVARNTPTEKKDETELQDISPFFYQMH